MSAMQRMLTFVRYSLFKYTVLSHGAIIGIVFAAIFVIILFTLLLACVYYIGIKKGRGKSALMHDHNYDQCTVINPCHKA